MWRSRPPDETRKRRASTRKPVRLEPNYSVAHNNLGNMRLAEGRVDGGRRHYERAVESGPTNAEAHNNLGAVLLATGDPAEALVHLGSAAPPAGFPDAHFNLARAYALLRRFDEAIRAATIADEQARRPARPR